MYQMKRVFMLLAVAALLGCAAARAESAPSGTV